jgi:hypothetical protein
VDATVWIRAQVTAIDIWELPREKVLNSRIVEQE